jgi:hypothetical protein
MKNFITVITLATLTTASAFAKCDLSPKSSSRAALRGVQPLKLKLTSKLDNSTPTPEPSIAGLWNVQFLADGQVSDLGFDLWNSDGTEVLNDTSPTSEGNVCLGVWAKTAPLTYQLKHPSWIYDDAGINVIGIVMIKEQIKLDPAGNAYAGTFSFEGFDLSGNSLFGESGTIVAERITATDDPSQSGLPGLLGTSRQ